MARKPLHKNGKALPHIRKKAEETKRGLQSPKRQGNRDISPRREGENIERSLKRRGNIRDSLGPPQPELQPRYPSWQFTPLTSSVSQVLREVQHEKFLRWPSQMRIDPTKRDTTKYCEFHRDHGHQTDNCIQLRKEIEYLIRHRYLCCYVAPEGRDQAPPPQPLQQTPTQH